MLLESGDVRKLQVNKLSQNSRSRNAAFAIVAAFLSGACSAGHDAGVIGVGDNGERPNFLLIVVDDMGFSDLGSFGGEIETPNLDQLALAGVRLTNFVAGSTCSPTRSMLLTGVDNHKAGLGNMLEELAPNQMGRPGYEGQLNTRVVTIASLLGKAGYRTMMTGKWHLGQGDDSGPSARGFDRSFTMLQGGASHFSDMRPAYAPTPEVKAKYRENGIALDALPDEFEYSSQFYVDRLITYLSESKTNDAPFFAYLSFTAPHWPLQAPAQTIEKYHGRYDAGYDELLVSRLARAKELGVIPETATVNPAPPKHQPWHSLGEEDRRRASRAMEIYAAMIDEVDRHSGRLFDYLRASGEFDNTVIIFLSDNGAEGHDLDETWPADLFPEIRKTIDESHDFSFEAMGHPGSYVLYGPDWGRAGSPAFNLYKAFPTDGGTRVAAFVHYPAFEKTGVVNTVISVKDITPTVLELAGVKQPDGDFNGRTVEKISGLSQVKLLSGRATGRDDKNRVLVFELFGKRSVRRGDWKLVHMPEPYGTNDWQLFDLTSDIGEANDVSAKNPVVVNELIAQWQKYVDENNVILPDWVSGY